MRKRQDVAPSVNGLPQARGQAIWRGASHGGRVLPVPRLWHSRSARSAAVLSLNALQTRRLRKSLQQRALMAVLLLLYTALLQWGYASVITQYFSYLGYHPYLRGTQEYLWAYLFAGLPALFLPTHLQRPSHLVAWYLATFVYLPTLGISALATELELTALLDLYAKLAVGLGLISMAGWIAPPATAKLRIPQWVIWGGLAIFVLAAVGYLVTQLGIRTPVSPFSVGIYEARLEARNWGVAVNYLMRLLGNVLGPFFLIWGLMHRRWILALSGVAIQLLIYSYDGTRSTLLIGLLILWIWYVAAKQKSYAFFVGSLIVLNAIILAADSYRGSVELASLLFRRLLVTPGLLTAYYYDFFQHNPPFLWSHSFLRGVVENPYGMAPAYVIGLNYFGDVETSANANLWADGIANIGSVGIVLISFAAAIVLWLTDGVSRGKELLAIVTIAAPASALINSAFTTSLITHGLLAAVLLVWIVDRDGRRLSL